MRILYFHQHFTTPAGAGGTRSYEFAKRLVDAGHQVTMVCGTFGSGRSGVEGPFRRGRREGFVEGIRVIEFALPYSNRDRFLKRVATFLRFAVRSVFVALTRPADVVFATTTPLTAAVPGIVAKILRRRRFVFEVRDLWPELPAAMGVIKNPIVLRSLSLLEHVAYRTADRIIALAPGIAEGIAAHGIARHRITLIPNGCDLDDFSPTHRSRSHLRDIAPGVFVALFSGAHGIANGLDAVLDSARVLRDRGRHDIKILFVGDGMLKPRLVARAETERLTNCIFWAPVPKREMRTITASADAGLQILKNVPAFYRGTSPNKFFDYLASGIPVITNYPGWIAEMIGAWECGVAVPPDDPSGIADALVRLADDREFAAASGRNARRLAEAQFSRDLLAKQFVEVVEVAARSGL